MQKKYHYAWWGYVTAVCKAYTKDLTSRELLAVNDALRELPQERFPYIEQVFFKKKLIEKACNICGIPVEVGRLWRADFIIDVAFAMGLTDTLEKRPKRKD